MRVIGTATSYPPVVGGAQAYLHHTLRAAQTIEARLLTLWTTHRTDWLLGTTIFAPGAQPAYVHDGIPVQPVAFDAITRARLALPTLLYYPTLGGTGRWMAHALEPLLAPHCAGADIIHNVRIGREHLSWASLAVARSRDVPFVLSPVHHPSWNGLLHRSFHALYREADAVICLSEGEREQLLALGVRPERTHLTGMGAVVAATFDGPAARRGLEIGDDPFVLFVGQKFEYKGVRPLLAASRLVRQRFPDVKFVFVGPRTEHSRQVFADLADPGVIEVDAVDLETKTALLAECALLCLPSTQESFGGVVAEAWAMGRPVVAADAPALRTVVAHGSDGLLVAPAADPLADAIATLLADPTLATRLGAAGRAKQCERYSWPVLARRTLAVYEHVRKGS